MWSESYGLTMLLDGVNYGSNDAKGTNTYKGRTAPPYLVVGRFNSDDKSTWLSPSQAEAKVKEGETPSWELANFALGEVTYYHRLLTQSEYLANLNALGLRNMRNVNEMLWFGVDMIDPKIQQLTAAKLGSYSKPGPIFSDSTKHAKYNLLYYQKAVEMDDDAIVRLGVSSTEVNCPLKIEECANVSHTRTFSLHVQKV